MKWRRWKIGLAVSAFTGVLMGLVTLGAVDKMTWKELLVILTVNAAKDLLLFMKDHPLDQVEDDPQVSRTLSLLALALGTSLILTGCAHASYATTRPDGTKTVFTVTTLFSTTAAKGLVVDGNGEKRESPGLRMTGLASDPNSASITATTEGLGNLIGAGAAAYTKAMGIPALPPAP